MMHASNDPIVDVIMETDEALLGRIARGEEDAFVRNLAPGDRESLGL